MMLFNNNLLTLELDCLEFPDFKVCFGDEIVAEAIEIEENQLYSYSGCQATGDWHLQRISQKSWPTTSSYYKYTDQLNPKTVYVVDSGIDLKHPDFEGRAKMGLSFYDSNTLHPHGTHVAGLVGSRSHGVAKSVQLVSVQVLDKTGRGPTSYIVRALEWIAHQPKPAIINMSLGGPYSAILNRVVDQLSKLGWIIVTAAGNDFKDACQVSPASAKSSITVGAFDKNMLFASFSNYGECVDVLAPGVDIISTFPDDQYAVWSGTSMATPIVAGIIANYGWISRSETLALLSQNALPDLVTHLPNKETLNRMIFQPQSVSCPALKDAEFFVF